MKIKRGDTSPRGEGKVLDELGNAVNVNGATITFSIRHSRQPSLKPIDGVAGAIANGPTGDIYYQWLSGDTEPLALGAWEGEFKVAGLVGGPYRVPTSGYLPIIVEERVGTA